MVAPNGFCPQSTHTNTHTLIRKCHRTLAPGSRVCHSHRYAAASRREIKLMSSIMNDDMNYLHNLIMSIWPAAPRYRWLLGILSATHLILMAIIEVIYMAWRICNEYTPVHCRRGINWRESPTFVSCLTLYGNGTKIDQHRWLGWTYRMHSFGSVSPVPI